jgi:hypothetical protein
MLPYLFAGWKTVIGGQSDSVRVLSREALVQVTFTTRAADTEYLQGKS